MVMRFILLIVCGCGLPACATKEEIRDADARSCPTIICGNETPDLCFGEVSCFDGVVHVRWHVHSLCSDGTEGAIEFCDADIPCPSGLCGSVAAGPEPSSCQQDQQICLRCEPTNEGGSCQADVPSVDEIEPAVDETEPDCTLACETGFVCRVLSGGPPFCEPYLCMGPDDCPDGLSCRLGMVQADPIYLCLPDCPVGSCSDSTDSTDIAEPDARDSNS